MISNYTEDIQLVNSTLKMLKIMNLQGNVVKPIESSLRQHYSLIKRTDMTGTDFEKLELLQCRWKCKGEQSF